jgi:hypothetical protein
VLLADRRGQLGLGTSPAIESITTTSTAPEPINRLATWRACSPLSGWHSGSWWVSTPVVAAHARSRACSVSMNPRPTKARARTLADLAMSQLAAGELDRAAHAAGEAFALGSAMGSRRVIRRVRVVRARMPEGSAATALDEHIAAVS